VPPIVPPIGLGCCKHLFWLTEDKTHTLVLWLCLRQRKDLEERQFEKILELEWVQDGLLSWPCQMLPTHSMTITLFKELEKDSRIASNYEHTKTPNLIAFSFGHKSETVMSATTLRSECPQSCCNHMRPNFDVTPNLKKSTSFHYIHVLLSVKLLPVGTNPLCTALWNMIH
jgi:hypothetical protein